MERFTTDGTRTGDTRTISKALKKYPKSIVISGNDDWHAQMHLSPNYFIRHLGFEDQIIAEISLICGSIRSGCVIKKQKWNQLQIQYKELFNKDINQLEIFNAKDAGVVIERRTNK